MKIIDKNAVLSNGVEIPRVGYGTYQIHAGEETITSICKAFEAGYRHIDTAAVYGNELSIGKAVKQCDIPREELFIASKLWNTNRGYENTLSAFDKTLKRLKLDYLDLYLIHWPAASGSYDNWREINCDTWRAFERIYKNGQAKAIGVCNFTVKYLNELIETTDIAPIVNQIEYHPGQMQIETVDYCRSNNIDVEAWSPLGTGKMLDNAMLKAIAQKYDKSVAQICVRWCLQNGVIPLVKSVNELRMSQNIKVFNFEISSGDMQTINNMPYFGGSGLDPDNFIEMGV